MKLDDATLAKVITPALLIDLTAVQRNVDRLVAMAGLERLRPHVKTSKLVRTFELLHASGLRRFKCATTREAEYLLSVVEDGADVLVAYPHQGPALLRLAALADAHPGVRLALLTEDADHARAVPDELGLFVDVNIGMNRTGVPVDRVETIERIVNAAGHRFRGVHAYEGHVHAGTTEERRAQCRAAYEPLMATMLRLEERFVVPELVTSGTPSFAAALAYEPFTTLTAVHRVSPGTVVYDDLRTDDCEELDFESAAQVVARVVSHPAPGMLTLDAGSKAIDAAAGDPCAAVLGHPELTALTPSEEHLPCRVDGAPLPLGTAVRLVPKHVCPTVNLAESALVWDGEALTVAPVSSRAHDLWLDA